MKRVCIIAYSFYECDARVFRYGAALAERGDEVDVLSIGSGPEVPREEVVDGCRVRRLQDRKIAEKNQGSFIKPLLGFLWRASRAVSREHARRPYDVLHVHNIPDFLVFAGWRAKLGGAKVILDIHDLMPDLFASKFGRGQRSFMVWALEKVEWCSAAFADHVIMANDLWVEKYTARAAPRAKVSVSINYVETRLFHPRPRTRTDDRLIVIFPGTLQWHQGLDIAIRAFERVAREVPNAFFHIYGEGQAKPELIRLAAELRLEERVKFFGFVPTKDIADIMANADLGVVPKRADSFGNEAYSTKILEFMSLGVPVIASSTKIDRFYFNDSVLRFFESGNVDQLGAAMVEYLTQPALRRAMAERASAFARQNSWEDRKADYLAFVDALCTRV